MERRGTIYADPKTPRLNAMQLSEHQLSAQEKHGQRDQALNAALRVFSDQNSRSYPILSYPPLPYPVLSSASHSHARPRVLSF